MEYTIDATNKSLGRLATEAATILMGKNKASFARNVIAGNKVVVTNASKLKISPKKLDEKIYTSYSGYPGGLKTARMGKVIDQKGYKEVVAKAVKGMLPDNKLKKDMLKLLTVTD